MPIPDLEAIAEAVRTAWADNPPPELISDCSCDYCGRMVGWLTARDPLTIFQDIPAEARLSLSGNLPLLSPEAQRHFLPGWLLGVLDELEEALTVTGWYSSLFQNARTSSLFWNLADPDWDRSRYSAAQRAAIAQVLMAVAVLHVSEPWNDRSMQHLARLRWDAWDLSNAWTIDANP
ncbi:MAG: hypothetical protein R3C39_16385 [Dehalococcoidia bacterium]